MAHRTYISVTDILTLQNYAYDVTFLRYDITDVRSQHRTLYYTNGKSDLRF